MTGTVDVTIVAVSGERFGGGAESLAILYQHTHLPFKLIYVDGDSPPPIREQLEKQAEVHGFTLLRSDRDLVPNQARNLGIAQAETKYVVLIDDDFIVSPGWLHHLRCCAEETGASIVTPLYIDGDADDAVVCMAGGTIQVDVENGRRVLRCERHFYGQTLRDTAERLKRTLTGFAACHCLLARRDTFDALGPLDEQLLNACDHFDLALALQQAGGAIYFEPDAVVSRDRAGGLTWHDVPQAVSRRGDERLRTSVRRFIRKWDLPEDEAGIRDMYRYVESYRRHPLSVPATLGTVRDVAAPGLNDVASDLAAFGGESSS